MRRVSLPSIVVAAIVVPAIGLAAVPPNADARRKAVTDALDKEDLDRAIALGESALGAEPDPVIAEAVAEACFRKARAAAQQDKPPAELLAHIDRGLRAVRTAKLLKNRGRVLSQMPGREMEAYEAYEESIERGGTGKDLADAAAEMSRLYAGLSANVCRLSVVSQPAGADVRVGAGARASRKAPFKAWLPRGSHAVEASLPGREPSVRQVDCTIAPAAVVFEFAASPSPKTPDPGGPPHPTDRTVPPPPTSPEPAASKPGSALLPWLTVGVGLVLVAAGVGMNVDYNRRTAEDQSAGEKYAAVGCYGGGAALVLGGLLWRWLGPQP